VGVAKLSTDGAQPTTATVSNITFYSLLSTDTKPGIYSAQWPVACSSIFAITFLVCVELAVGVERPSLTLHLTQSRSFQRQSSLPKYFTWYWQTKQYRKIHKLSTTQKSKERKTQQTELGNKMGLFYNTPEPTRGEQATTTIHIHILSCFCCLVTLNLVPNCDMYFNVFLNTSNRNKNKHTQND